MGQKQMIFSPNNIYQILLHHCTYAVLLDIRNIRNPHRNSVNVDLVYEVHFLSSVFCSRFLSVCLAFVYLACRFN